jgi:hypothetical protein
MGLTRFKGRAIHRAPFHHFGQSGQVGRQIAQIRRRIDQWLFRCHRGVGDRHLGLDCRRLGGLGVGRNRWRTGNRRMKGWRCHSTATGQHTDDGENDHC